LLLGSLLLGCSEPSGITETLSEAYVPRHAERFRIDRQGETLLLTVWPPWRDPEAAGSGMRYRLVPEGVDEPVSAAGDGVRVVRLPVGRLVTTSTTELAHLEWLDATEVLVGHSESDYVSSPTIRRRIERGEVVEVGGGSGLQPELLLEVEPDAVLADFLAQSELDQLAQVEAAGIPIVLVPAFLESSPLGRAEWIVVTGLLVSRFDEAVSRFEDVERSYLALVARIGEEIDDARPSAVTGGPWDDVWHVPGGRSYAARFLADAGARYLWADDDSTGALPLGIETVYEAALDADVWLYPSSWRSLEEIAQADGRLSGFRSFQRGDVFGNDRRMNDFGGNDFWESGVARPDLVLADLVKIFHPELVPEHEMVYHRRLPAGREAD
jgi:iron complex transport system substrate-binding protein